VTDNKMIKIIRKILT